MKGNRKVFVSGYGPGSNNRESMALYTVSDKMEIEHKIWSDKVEAPSFLCTYQDICFTIREDARNGSVLCYKREDEQYVLQDELFLEGGALCYTVPFMRLDILRQ
jgi:6-phosphogluconolactonase